MADVKVRKLDDWVVASYKSRAERAGRSLEEELRVTLTDVVAQDRASLMARIEEHQRLMREKYGTLPDSTPLIREDRDSRG